MSSSSRKRGHRPSWKSRVCPLFISLERGGVDPPFWIRSLEPTPKQKVLENWPRFSNKGGFPITFAHVEGELGNAPIGPQSGKGSRKERAPMQFPMPLDREPWLKEEGTFSPSEGLQKQTRRFLGLGRKTPGILFPLCLKSAGKRFLWTPRRSREGSVPSSGSQVLSYGSFILFEILGLWPLPCKKPGG